MSRIIQKLPISISSSIEVCLPVETQEIKSVIKNKDKKIEKIVQTWLEVLKYPFVSTGYFTQSEHSINIASEWSIPDPSKKENISFSKNFCIPKSILNWPENANADEILDLSSKLESSGPIPFVSKLNCISNSGQKRAVLVSGKPSTAGIKSDDKSAGSADFLQIWSNNSLLKTYDLKELDKHKAVYTNSGLGCLSFWSSDETKFVYLAEKKVKNEKPFFSSYTSNNDDNITKPPQVSKPEEEETDEFGEGKYRQNWGEQLTELCQSVIVVFDLTTDKFTILELPDEIFPADIQFLNPGGIVGVGYTKELWKVGLIYCTNRESRIFKVDLNGENFKYLSEAGLASFSPRVRPDGQFVIWQERIATGPHQKSQKIIGLSLAGSGTDINTQILYETNPENGFPIYGFLVDSLPANCWTPDGKRFYALTIGKGQSQVIEFQNDEAKVLEELEGIKKILWTSNEYLFTVHNSIDHPPSLRLIKIDNNKEKYKQALLTSIYEKDFDYKIKLIPGIDLKRPPSVFVTPNSSTSPLPLIALIHGGPNSVFYNAFNREILFWLKLGFATLQVNYIGSLGTEKDATEELLGKIGDIDVKDCQYIIEKVFNEEKIIDKTKKVALIGGSHGGFLTCHLITKYPDTFSAAVSRNPVCDLNSKIATTDITDWVYEQTGLEKNKNDKILIPSAMNLENLTKLFNASPINNNLEGVKTPILFLLGSEDLRVSMSQGFAFYRALLAKGKETDFKVYPDCHPLAKPGVNFNTICHSAIWISKHLKIDL